MIVLRRATDADVALLVAWDADADVAAAHGEDAGAFDWAAEVPRPVPWREILVADEVGGDAASPDGQRPVGVLVVIDPRDEESHYWGDVPAGLRALDVHIGRPADRGRGLGTEMLCRAVERCFAEPAVDAVLVDPLVANERAVRFFARLGFVLVERRWFGGDECAVMRLDRRAVAPAGETP